MGKTFQLSGDRVCGVIIEGGGNVFVKVQNRDGFYSPALMMQRVINLNELLMTARFKPSTQAPCCYHLASTTIPLIDVNKTLY